MIKLAILEGWNNDEIVETLLDKNNKISEHIYTAHPENPKRYAREQVEKRRKKLEARIVPVVNHMRRARLFRDQRRPNLRHWRGDFYDWIDGSHYQEIEKDTIIAEIWKYLDQALCRNDKEKIVPFYPQLKFVNETFAALKAISQMRDNLETPFWIEGGVGGELIAFPNGLLDLDNDNKLYPSNPNYFTLGALGFNYQPKGGEPKEWLKFLDQIFDKQNNAAEAKAQIDALQEIFGYLLTGDISQEKCFLWLGPPRSGKGTLGNMIKALLAATAVVGPKLSDFGTEFGLSLLIGRQVAVIDDLRVGRGEQNLMVENVLKITGRGLFSINRKYKPFWTGLLPVKLVFISNKMPQLGDDSPALASRFIILETRQSFLGREDPDLFETKLRPELVDVFHWAMDGLRRLRGRGKFAEPQTSAEARERMANLGSLVMAFITDRCELKPEAYANKQRLYNAYKEYAAENDMPPDTYEKFYEALYAATGGKVRTARPTDKETGKQVRTIQGITLRSEQKQERQTSMYDRLDGPPPHDPDDPGPEGCYH
jgi:P4 family phage/plasmid primase-like protien